MMADVVGELVSLPRPGYSDYERPGDPEPVPEPDPPEFQTFWDQVYAGPRITRYDPLGGGIVRPFYRSEHGDFCSNQGVDLVMSNIGQVFGTVRGSLPWRTEFGSDLEPLRHRSNRGPVRDLAAVYVREALERWDRRVRLVDMSVEGGGVAKENQIELKAVVRLEGLEGEHRLPISMRQLDRPLLGSVTARDSADGYARLPRGMGHLLDLPVPAVDLDETDLNVGLVRPFRRMHEGDFLSGGGAAVVLSNIEQVFGTTPGTLPWRTDFGADLERLRHRRNGPVLRELARYFVEQALVRWEPRSRVKAVEVVSELGTENSFTIRISCDLAFLETGIQQLIDLRLK